LLLNRFEGADMGVMHTPRRPYQVPPVISANGADSDRDSARPRPPRLERGNRACAPRVR